MQVHCRKQRLHIILIKDQRHCGVNPAIPVPVFHLTSNGGCHLERLNAYGNLEVPY